MVSPDTPQSLHKRQKYRDMNERHAAVFAVWRLNFSTFHLEIMCFRFQEQSALLYTAQCCNLVLIEAANYVCETEEGPWKLL